MDERLITSPHLSRELMELIGETHMGSGSTRDVWSSEIFPDVVFKFEPQAHSFANVAEWDLWDESLSFPEMNKWLAPCVGISPCGSILVMKKCEPLDVERIPKQIPAWAADVKTSNWGMFECKEHGHRAVMMDYHITISQRSKRMKNAHWINE